LSAILERHFGIVQTMANLGYRLRNKSVEYLNIDFRDEILYSIGAGVPEHSRFYSLDFYGSTPAADAFVENETPVEVLAGAKQAIAKYFDVEAGVGRGLTTGYGSPEFRAFAGFRFTTDVPEPKQDVTDTDKDGILDVADRCPLAAGDFDAFQDEDGCPDPDNDNDGIADAKDKCPNAAEDFDKFEDQDGCPEERFWAQLNLKVVDTARSAIQNADVYLVESGEIRKRGKANPKGDLSFKVPSGTYTVRASAPEYDDVEYALFVTKPAQSYIVSLTGRPTKGFVHASLWNEYGKPLTGTISIRPVNVHLETTAAKPNVEATLEPGIYHVVATATGYMTANTEITLVAGKLATTAFHLVEIPKPAKPSKVVVTKEAIQIKEQVRFVTGKARIQTSSYDLLDQVAGVIKDNPNITLVRIVGHTDNVGKPSFNLKLSQKRANAVREFLISRGVSGDRLTAAGLGDSKPIADNKTAKGKELNRRVEFLIGAENLAAK
jgi:outer membrane protein OmpA-like peptidoglycan-associated protein